MPFKCNMKLILKMGFVRLGKKSFWRAKETSNFVLLHVNFGILSMSAYNHNAKINSIDLCWLVSSFSIYARDAFNHGNLCFQIFSQRSCHDYLPLLLLLYWFCDKKLEMVKWISLKNISNCYSDLVEWLEFLL